jgi:DUF4097 and DUF4098 domain-containing protein YvlB
MKDGKMAILAIGSTALGFVLLATHAPGGFSLEKVRAVAFGHTQEEYQQQVMLERAFTVGAGGALVIDVQDADVTVTTAAGGNASVTVLAGGRDQDWVRQVYERMRFEAALSGNTLTVRSHNAQISSDEWRQHRGVSLEVRVAIPSRFDVQIATADGDVSLGDIEGAVQVRTADGDVQIGKVTGSARLATSDGDVHVGNVTGSAEIQTADGDVEVGDVSGGATIQASDGDLALGAISGPEIALRTADGDVAARSLSAEKITVRAQDGDVTLQSVAGVLDASTGDGDLTVRFAKAAPASISTGSGDVTLSADGAFGYDLDLSGGDLSVPSGMTVQGTIGERSARGTINGGGPLLRVRSGDGSVVIKLGGAR